MKPGVNALRLQHELVNNEASVFSLSRELLARIGVPSKEILEDDFRVSEIRGVVVIGLSVNSGEGVLEVSRPPVVLLDIRVLEEVGVLLDQLLSSDITVFIEESALFVLSSVISAL
jgi:hypothetical protein